MNWAYFCVAQVLMLKTEEMIPPFRLISLVSLYHLHILAPHTFHAFYCLGKTDPGMWWSGEKKERG